VARVICGKKIASDVKARVAERVKELSTQNITPGLGVVLVGEDPASKVYVGMKEKACKAVGLFTETNRLSADASQDDVMAAVKAYNENPAIHGILVQLPLPGDLQERPVIEAIDPRKDVDGLTPVSMGNLLAGSQGFVPCTPAGVMEILASENVETEGKHVVVVGRSNLVGKPISVLLARKAASGNSTVTMCHSRTPDLGSYTRRADILIVAVGYPECVNGDMVKEGAVVIDVGINRVDNPGGEKPYKLVGDVQFESAEKVASAITPVPGGVGPLTIACLLQNTMTAAERIHGA
jgi:methylenetetrahydrofolate dehydrogenase (NADP+) / methenyltetrahydrofolate cyclohydrolase